MGEGEGRAEGISDREEGRRGAADSIESDAAGTGVGVGEEAESTAWLQWGRRESCARGTVIWLSVKHPWRILCEMRH